MANRIIPMILIVEVFTHKCFDDNYHKIAYTSKHINIVEISFYNIPPRALTYTLLLIFVAFPVLSFESVDGASVPARSISGKSGRVKTVSRVFNVWLENGRRW
jgi:hypothetical protein